MNNTRSASQMGCGIYRSFILLLCTCFALTSSLGQIAYAQTSGSDFQAPIIEHEELSSSISGEVESFVATVVDNEQLENVSLFYRYKGNTEFLEIPMQPLTDSSFYTATVDTSELAGTDSAIEYYIRAEDASGNLVLKGFAFEPLVRVLNAFDGATDALGSTTETPATSEQPVTVTDPAPRKKVNWLYVGLGVLLLGGIAAGAGGGGGSDGGEQTSSCSSNCSVTLTLSTP